MSLQVLNEVSEDNLIDLGPGSPAVVSPMVGNTAPASTVSTQLAGLGEYFISFHFLKNGRKSQEASP